MIRTGGLAVESNETDYQFVDGDGEIVARVGSIEVFDSGDSGRLREEEAEYRHVFEIEVIEENQLYRVTWVVDAEYLADAVYPVTIDPVIKIIVNTSGIGGLNYIRDVEIDKLGSSTWYKYNDHQVNISYSTDWTTDCRALIGFQYLNLSTWNLKITEAAIWMYDQSDFQGRCTINAWVSASSWAEDTTVTLNDRSAFFSDTTNKWIGSQSVGKINNTSLGYTMAGGNVSGGNWYKFNITPAMTGWKNNDSYYGNPSDGLMFNANMIIEDRFMYNPSFRSSNLYNSYNSRLIVDFEPPVPTGITSGGIYFIKNTSNTKAVHAQMDNSAMRYEDYKGSYNQAFRLSRIASGSGAGYYKIYPVADTLKNQCLGVSGTSNNVTWQTDNAYSANQMWEIEYSYGNYYFINRAKRLANSSYYLAASGTSLVTTGSSTQWNVTRWQLSGSVVWPMAEVHTPSESGRNAWGWRTLNAACTDWDFHEAVDLGTTAYNKYNVKVMMNGIVREVRYANTFGNYIVIEHQNGLHSIYMHLDTLPTLSEGQTVSAGTIIGKNGATGGNYINHLDFRIYYKNNNTYLNFAHSLNPLPVYGCEDARTANPNPMFIKSGSTYVANPYFVIAPTFIGDIYNRWENVADKGTKHNTHGH